MFFDYLFILIIIYFLKEKYINYNWGLGIGDWGLGIGDWAQSPIPNPQSPIPNPQNPNFLKLFNFRLI